MCRASVLDNHRVALTLTGINRFPVKSCRGQSMTSALVEAWGLAGDRRWMVVDETGECVTAREHPAMLLVEPAESDGGLAVAAPDAPTLTVRVPRAGYVDVSVFGRAPFRATLADDEAHAWFTKLIGEPVRLVYFDDPTRRTANAAFAGPDAPVSFADAYPVHVATTASLDALNALIAADGLADQGQLPMIRFRPNVVVDGSAAWQEDGWRRVRIGAATFRAVKGCDRCAIPTTDHVTAERFKEPTYTLAKHRRWDGGVWFGMQLVPENAGVRIQVGDEVEILSSVAAPDGPPR